MSPLSVSALAHLPGPFGLIRHIAHGSLDGSLYRMHVLATCAARHGDYSLL